MPAAYRKLLDHHHHMTVTVERYHGSLVDVQVLERQMTETHYARKILLARQSDGHVVQFGIVRLNLHFLAEDVRQEILSERIPLGRVLIEKKVMRKIRLCGLWQVAPGPDLQQLMHIEPGKITCGRTAMIDCDGQPAIELLEIVTPVESSAS